MKRYEIIYPNQIDEYEKKGYEFVTAWSEHHHSGGGTMTSSGSIQGQINGEQVSLSLNLPVATSGGSSSTTKFLMQLTPAARTLYAEKLNI